MTTIVFDGKVLVADRLRCTVGVKDTQHDVCKIAVCKDVTWRGEKVLAIGGGGSIDMIGTIRRLFVEDPDEFENCYKAAIKTGLLKKLDRDNYCKMMFITDKDVYTLNTIDLGRGKILQPFNKDHTFYELMEMGENPLCILGSGMHHVETLIRLFNMPPELALAAITLVPSSVSGGTINVIEFADRVVTGRHFTVYHSPEELYREVMLHFNSDDCAYLGDMPDLHFEELVSKKKPDQSKEPASTAET
jgi:hypothetical protein